MVDFTKHLPSDDRDVDLSKNLDKSYLKKHIKAIEKKKDINKKKKIIDSFKKEIDFEFDI